MLVLILKRGCKYNLNNFCYICSENIVKEKQGKFTQLLKKKNTSVAYFELQLGTYGNVWALYALSKSFGEVLLWSLKVKK